MILGEYKSISDVQIGEKVLSADIYGNKKYSEVVYIPHEKNQEKTIFTNIQTVNRDVKITRNHLLPAGECSSERSLESSSLPLIFASKVNKFTAVKFIYFLIIYYSLFFY